MIKKLLILFLLTSTSWGQYTGIKPILGRQIKWGHPPARGLVGCWLFNENPGKLGKVYDLSGNGNTGSLREDAHGVSGKFGPALDFDGTGDCVLGGTLSLSAPYTIVAWINHDVINVNDTFFSLGTDVVSYPRFRVVADNKLLAQIDSDHYRYNNTALAANTWYQTAIVIPDDTNYLTWNWYLNGVIDSGSGDNGTPVLPVGWRIGIDKTTGGWEGQIDHVMLYNRALSAQEIQQLYISPFCMFSPNFDLMLYSAISVGVSVSQFILISN